MYSEFRNIIKVDPESRIPKYRQVVDSIKDSIIAGKLGLNQKIPSINGLSEEFYLSRDTVEKAYNLLKAQNIIKPVRGKGFYIARTDLNVEFKVLFMVNKLSVYKLRIYNSFVQKVWGNVKTDLQIYHCDETLFCNILERRLVEYDFFVIMPHFKSDKMSHWSNPPKVVDILKKISRDKLIVIDNKIQDVAASVEIFQDFENDIYNSLKWFLPKISKYKRMIIAYRRKSIYPYPMRILHGFRKFCVEVNMDFEIIDEIYDDTILKEGDLFLVLEEADLVNLYKQAKKKKMVLGRDMGIIAYNETPLKELLNIAVVTTDFVAMGEMTGEMLLTKVKGSMKNPFYHIDRDSL